MLGATRAYDTFGQPYRLQRVRSPTGVHDLVTPDQSVPNGLPGTVEAVIELTFSGIPRRKRKLQLVDVRFAEGRCELADVPLSRD